VHGFRYMMIQDVAQPTKDTCIGMVVRSAAPSASSFTTNNPIINAINSAVVWGQASNLMSLPTDCPQRDERKGWMGDASLTVDEALYNFKLAPFYYNFLDLIRVSQGPKGEVPDTVPLSFGSQQGDPSWGSGYNNIVWNLYKHNGDTGIVANHYPAVKKWADFLWSQYNTSGLIQMVNSTLNPCCMSLV
jgi:alpha-L-rhamnosidase